MTKNALFYLNDSQLPLSDYADGIYIFDTDGKKYIDACSGAMTTNLGHNHPKIKAAMLEQMDKITFSYRTQFENQETIDLANELVNLTNNDLDQVFFVGSGSEAVESAIKLAKQYFFSLGDHLRNQFVSLRPSYHGSTLGALGLTAYKPLEEPFDGIVIPSIKVDSPSFYRKEESSCEAHVSKLIDKMKKMIAQAGNSTIAAIILEPIGGASTGARMFNQSYFTAIRKICDDIGALLIFDEVLSGMGRTGKWFGYQHWNVKPDIMALAKGLGAGYYPVAAMLAKEAIVQPVQDRGGFMHGHTYAGNPLACATGMATIKAIKDENILLNVVVTGQKLKKGLEELQNKFDFVGDVRGIGLLQAIEFVADKITKEPFASDMNVFSKFTGIAKDNGLLIYPRRTLDGIRGDHFLITPPLNITEDEINELLTLLEQSLNQFNQAISQSVVEK
ncbi:MAG: aminotransferase family protein [Ostreibacterium sp.]